MTEDRQALLRRLWPTRPNTEIADVLGWTHASSVTHAARRLGLPPKEPKRNITKAQQVNRERLAEKRRLQALGEHDPEMPGPLKREELPCCFVCGGRARDWDGHATCRGRRVA